MDVVVVKDKEQFISAASTGNIIVWNGREEIDDLLEKVGGKLDKYTKANLRLCKEIKFKKPVTVEKSNGEKFKVKSLSELLKIGSFSWQDLIIVESNDISEAINLIQQFINLGIGANILTREELLKKKVIQNFLEYRDHFRKFLVQFRKRIENIKTNYDIVKESKSTILKLLSLIEEEIKKSYEETIKVAIFATKKSGKSMIVNALLGEEYAPTSQELPTPNVIIYKPHNAKYLKLLYKERELIFNSAEELKQFIKEEFNKVKISGKKLPVMTIFYPKKEGINFEIYDTPGPDLAFSEHADFIDEYIEKADVSVFVIDYTKYAQSTEVELFKKIKASFEKKGKIYSLICAINKLDMMYLDTDTEKIKVRVSSFIERKLRELGFKNFIVIPISALIYFYLTKMAKYISEIKEVENLRSFLVDKEDDEEFLEASGIPIEIFAEINAFTGKIKQIHKIKQPTYKDIINLTGFESFERYLIYIAQEKATVEKIFSLIRVIDSYLTQISNYINSSSALLSKDIDKIKAALNKFIKDAKEYETREQFNNFFKEVEGKFVKFIDKILDDIVENLKREIESEVTEKVSHIKVNMSEDIWKLKRKKIGRYEFEKKYQKISFLIDKEFIYNEFSKLLEKNYKELNSLLEKFKKAFDEKFKKIKNTLINAIKSLEKELNRHLPESEEVSKISLQLPELDLEFDIEEIKNKIKEGINKLKTGNYITIKEEIFADAIKGGFFRWLFSFFGEDRYEVNEELLFKEIDSHSKDLIEKLSKEISSIFPSLRDDIKTIEEIFKRNLEDIRKQTQIYLDSVYLPIRKLKNSLDREREEKQSLIEFLYSLGNEWENLINIWKTNIVGDYFKYKGGL